MHAEVRTRRLDKQTGELVPMYKISSVSTSWDSGPWLCVTKVAPDINGTILYKICFVPQVLEIEFLQSEIFFTSAPWTVYWMFKLSFVSDDYRDWLYKTLPCVAVQNTVICRKWLIPAVCSMFDVDPQAAWARISHAELRRGRGVWQTGHDN